MREDHLRFEHLEIFQETETFHIPNQNSSLSEAVFQKQTVSWCRVVCIIIRLAPTCVCHDYGLVGGAIPDDWKAAVVTLVFLILVKCRSVVEFSTELYHLETKESWRMNYDAATPNNQITEEKMTAFP